MKVVRYAIGLLALAGFVAAMSAHVASLKDIDVAARWPAVWGLHAGIFVVFLPFIFSSKKMFGPKPRLRELSALVPPWVAAMALILMIYAVCNFILFMTSGLLGDAKFEDGRYVLMSHGRLVRELTQDEYVKSRAMEVRGFSGHWMLFYFVPFA